MKTITDSKTKYNRKLTQEIMPFVKNKLNIVKEPCFKHNMEKLKTMSFLSSIIYLKIMRLRNGILKDNT